MEHKYIVYKHTNQINQKVYVGITKNGDDPNKRWRNGFGYEENLEFFSDIVSFGWNNFTHEILEEDLTELEALKQEKYYIDLFQSNKKEFGYNKVSRSGYFSEEGIQKLRQIQKGKPKTPESIQKQMKTKQERYGSGRGKNFHGQTRKVRCKETGDVFMSIAEADRWSHTTTVGKCCQGKLTHAGRHPITKERLSWEYADDLEEVTKTCEEDYQKNNHKQIRCIETQQIYKNASQASKQTGVGISNILRVCHGKYKTAGGFHWEFFNKGD